TGSSSMDTSTTTDSSVTADTTTTTTPAATTTTSNDSSSSTPFSMAVNVDGAKDLVPFTFGSVSAILLNPHMTAFDTTQVGTISGTLNLSKLDTALPKQSNTSFVDIQVTAESLSTDGTRHVAVISTPVRTDGTFTLYPLATSSSSPTSYDLVVHGPSIATIIVKGVTVNVGDPTSTTPVNIGTITARSAAASFKVSLNTTTPLPAGSLVGFHQTLPRAGEVPYLIVEQPIDPFSRAFDSNLSPPVGTIASNLSLP